MNKRRLLFGGQKGGSVTGWNLNNATYDTKYIFSEIDTSNGIFFKPDGSLLFAADSNADAVYQYSLSTAWDVDTITYDSASYSFSSEVGILLDISMKADGAKIYTIDQVGDEIFQHSLGTAWNISTSSYDSKNYISSEITESWDFYLKDDGIKLYIADLTTSYIFQYTLGTAWDISTSSYDSKSYDFGTESGDMIGIYFKTNGTGVYILDNADDKVYQYTLSTAWDISTASYDNISLDLSGVSGTFTSIFIKPDGSKLYLGDQNVDGIHQWSM